MSRQRRANRWHNRTEHDRPYNHEHEVERPQQLARRDPEGEDAALEYARSVLYDLEPIHKVKRHRQPERHVETREDAAYRLKNLLGSNSIIKRRRAIQALEKLGSAAYLAVDDLQRLMVTAEVGDDAIRALQAIYSSQPWCKLRSTNSGVKSDGIRELAEHRFQTIPRALMSRLISALDDADPRVRDASLYALGRFGPSAKAALPALEKAAGNCDDDLWSDFQLAICRVKGRREQSSRDNRHPERQSASRFRQQIHDQERDCQILAELRSHSRNMLQQMIHEERDINVRRLVIRVAQEKDKIESRQIGATMVAEFRAWRTEEVKFVRRGLKEVRAGKTVIELLRCIIDEKLVLAKIAWDDGRIHPLLSERLAELRKRVDELINEPLSFVFTRVQREHRLSDIPRRLRNRTSDSLDAILARLKTGFDPDLETLIRNVIRQREGLCPLQQCMDFSSPVMTWWKRLTQFEPRVRLLGPDKAHKLHAMDLRQMQNPGNE